MAKKTNPGRYKSLFLIPLVCGIMAAAVSCTDFFSTSLAPWATRDPDKVIGNVTAGNVNDMVALAENDPSLSLAVLNQIQTAINGNISDQEKLVLQNAAVGAAINASGLGQAALEMVSNISNFEGSDSADLLIQAIDGMKNLEEAASVLSGILPDPSDRDSFDAFTESASADDLAMAAALLIAGEAKKMGGDNINDYISSLGQNIEEGKTLTYEENLAYEIALAALDRSQELSGPLGDLIAGLNLNTNRP